MSSGASTWPAWKCRLQPCRPSLPGAPTPSSDVDLAVKQMKTRINNKIAAAMKGPAVLCKMYNAFAWLLEEDVDEYLDNFVAACDNSTPTRVDFHEEFEKLALAKRQIAHLSFRHETFELVRVDTSEAHASLLARLEERHDGLGNLLATQVRPPGYARHVSRPGAL